jgi:hypothetical protein
MINKPGTEWDLTSEPIWNGWETDTSAAGVANADEIFNTWKQMRDDYVN